MADTDMEHGREHTEGAAFTAPGAQQAGAEALTLGLAAGQQAQGLPQPGLYGVYPGRVVAVDDPQGLGRVRVQLLWARDPGGAVYEAWARLATLMAGDQRGTWFIPEVDDEVLLAFEAGDPRRPYVVGALWNGQDAPPESMDGGGDNNLRVIQSRSGLRLTFDDTDGAERLVCETPHGQRLTLDDAVQAVVVEDGLGNSIRLDATGVTVVSAVRVKVEASTVDVTAAAVQVDAGVAKFSGVVQCSTLIANAVVSSSYTPGAGNIW